MKKSISIYRLLKYINILFFILMIYTYAIEGNNMYINQWTIFLNTALIVTSHFVLNDAAKNKNPLLTILAYIMILHYELRIITLNYTEFSTIFGGRVNINASGVNRILFYCLLAYLVLWIAFHYRWQIKTQTPIESHENFKSKAPRNVLIILYGSFLLQEMSGMGVPGISQLVSIASTFFFNNLFIMVFGVGFFIYRWGAVSFKQRALFFLILAIYIIVHTVGGSRSTLYTIAIVLFLCLLAFGKDNIRKIYVIIAAAVVPVAVLFFLYATFTRSYGEKATNVSEMRNIAGLLAEKMDGQDMKLVLGPVFDRIAFFDFTAEMVQNRDYLKHYINPVNYAESVVDNLLTPGFNIFDMPRMSFVVLNCYSIKEKPGIEKYKLDDPANYHSDCFTWFGEAYLIFGFLALPVILFVGLLIRKKYLNSLREESVTSSWKRIIILYITYTLLYSYGLDWLFIDIVGLVINYYIFKAVTINKRKKQVLITN